MWDMGNVSSIMAIANNSISTQVLLDTLELYSIGDKEVEYKYQLQLNLTVIE